MDSNYKILVAPTTDRNNRVWLALDDYADSYDMEVAAATATAPSDSFTVYDSEGFPNLVIGEGMSLDDVWDIWDQMTDAESEGKLDAFLVYMKSDSSFPDYQRFLEAYEGEYTTEREFAEALLESTGELNDAPEFLARYFDIDSFTYDIFHGDYWHSNGYVFRAM